MKDYKHSVSLNADKCKGCTHCLKRCPTEAIRIREGKAEIDTVRCIDCGECIRVCPYKAKKSTCDKLAEMDRFKYKIALPGTEMVHPAADRDHRCRTDLVLYYNAEKEGIFPLEGVSGAGAFRCYRQYH